MSIPPPHLTPTTGERGLATADPAALVTATLSAWDDFIAITSEMHDSIATVRSAVIEMGTWPGQDRFAELLAEARGQTPPTGVAVAPPTDPNAQEIKSALQRSRDALASWVESDSQWQYTGLQTVQTSMGALPLLTALHGASYQQVTSLLPIAKDQPELVSPLLGTAVTALVDTAGAFGARTGTTASIVAVSDVVTIGSGVLAENWRTAAVSPMDLDQAGPRVQADALTLISITAGHADVPALYRGGQLRVSDMAGLMRWLPVLEGVPGLPAAGAIGKAAKYVAAVSSVLSKLRFGR